MTTDYTRYEPGNDEVGRLGLWCIDCNPRTPIWTEDDAAEQVTAIGLANLIAIADEHEAQRHRPCGKQPSMLLRKMGFDQPCRQPQNHPGTCSFPRTRT